MPELKRWTAEWGGMKADFEALTRSKARYMAYKILKEYWGLNDIKQIKVWASRPFDPNPIIH